MKFKVVLIALLLGFSVPLCANITAVSSSVSPAARSLADYACNPGDDSATQSQGPTLNPLSASVNAVSVCGGASVSTFLTIGATWASADAGTISWTNVGWSTSNVANGYALANMGTDFTYDFIANVNEVLSLAYTITGGGDVGGFGLNGFYATLTGPGGGITPLLGINTSGTYTWNLVAGNNYSLNIHNQANVSGFLGSISDSMNGEFNFSAGNALPEPSALLMLGSGLAGVIATLRGRLMR